MSGPASQMELFARKIVIADILRCADVDSTGGGGSLPRLPTERQGQVSCLH